MRTDYNTLKDKITILNDLNDKINFIEWNNEDGPKFSNVKEMKDFENEIEKGTFDFLLENGKSVNKVLQSYTIKKDSFSFIIYTYNIDNYYTTTMTIKNLTNDEIIEHLYEVKENNKNSALLSFEKVKNEINNNDINTIFEKLIKKVNETIKQLNIRYNEIS